LQNSKTFEIQNKFLYGSRCKFYKLEKQNKLENLESKVILQLNQVEDRVSQLQAQKVELAKAIAILSQIMANLTNR